MKITDLTPEQIAFYQAANRTWWNHGASPGPQYAEAISSISWGLDPSTTFGGDYYRIANERGLALEWAFRILEHLTDDHVLAPRANPLFPADWEELVLTVRAHAQKAYTESLEDSDSDMDAWKDETYFVKSVSWFLRNLSPFTIWVIHQRVEDAVLDDLRDNIVAWSAGEESRSHRVAEKAFANALRGIGDWLDQKTSEGGVSQAASGP